MFTVRLFLSLKMLFIPSPQLSFIGCSFSFFKTRGSRFAGENFHSNISSNPFPPWFSEKCYCEILAHISALLRSFQFSASLNETSESQEWELRVACRTILATGCEKRVYLVANKRERNRREVGLNTTLLFGWIYLWKQKVDTEIVYHLFSVMDMLKELVTQMFHKVLIHTHPWHCNVLLRNMSPLRVKLFITFNWKLRRVKEAKNPINKVRKWSYQGLDVPPWNETKRTPSSPAFVAIINNRGHLVLIKAWK